jgi:hypothetical protein
LKTHQEIDRRSLAMAQAIVEKIDHDPERKGLAQAKAVGERWFRQNAASAVAEWLEILKKPWPEIREILLDESEHGQRLRQSGPFGIVLSPQERWAIYRAFNEKD